MNDLFGALDVAEIPEFPDNGTHEYVLRYPPKIVVTASGKHKLVMEFFLDDEDSPFNGEKYAKWFNLSWKDEEVTSHTEFDAKMTRDYNVLKKWLMDLNVPEDEIKTFDFTELSGTRVNGYGFVRDKWDGSGKEYVIANITVA